MGSVKDLIILIDAKESRFGSARFRFSEDYSIFDWGKMPDSIKNKGKALAVMGAFNFEELEKRGIKTHYKGLVAQKDLLVKSSNLGEGCNGLDLMQIALAIVYQPIEREFYNEGGEKVIEYDYSFYEKNRGKLNNFLIPLEIIFRNGLPEGSSIFKRIKEAKRFKNDYIKDRALRAIYEELGLSSEPNHGDMLPKPIISYTTKLESGDRHLSDDEAYRISGLTEEEFANIKPLALEVNDIITEQAEKGGLKPHYDGKVEMLYFNGLVICDVVGTLDENRFGDLVSKEFLRQWYKKNQPEWVDACAEWKETGKDWQERCPIKPINLPEELSTLISQMYVAACNQYVQKRIFNVTKLEEVMEKLRVCK